MDNRDQQGCDGLEVLPPVIFLDREDPDTGATIWISPIMDGFVVVIMRTKEFVSRGGSSLYNFLMIID